MTDAVVNKDEQDQHVGDQGGKMNPAQNATQGAEESEAHNSHAIATSQVFEMDQDAEQETLLSLALPRNEERSRTTKKMNLLRRHRFLQPAKGKKRSRASVWRDFVSWTLTHRRCCSFLSGTILLLLAIVVPLAHRRSPNRLDGLDIKKIQHWCLEEDHTDCECPNPLLASPRRPLSSKWSNIHEINVQKAASAADTNVDVVFLGDSITEGWSGTSYGIPREDKQANVPVFSSFFDPSKGGEFTGLALGISGDTSPNLTWRLQNGEAPPNLRPRVWWVLIGTNDFQRNDPKCSEEVVLMGIQRVLLESKRRTKVGDTAQVVVNSLLPRSDDNQELRLTAKRLDDGGRTVWSAIQNVNEELERLCEETPGWEFFNATHIFARKLDAPPEKEEDSPYYIPERLMADQLHPTAEGYERWGSEIVERLHSLLDE